MTQLHVNKRHIYRGATNLTYCGQRWANPHPADVFAPCPATVEEFDENVVDPTGVCGNCKRLLGVQRRRTEAA